MKRIAVLTCLAAWIGVLGGEARAQKPPLLPEKDVAALANEVSGEMAKRNLEGIARFHRQRGSKGFHEAAELVADRLRAYGLGYVAILQFPADGKIFYGTQRSRPAWDAEMARLSELRCCDAAEDSKVSPDGSGYVSLEGAPYEQLVGSYDAEPVVLAEDSESAEVTAELTDVGEGTKESDYTGKDLKGKIVLVSAQPGAVQDLATGRFGAAGIVSYAQNQKTAWWGEDENLIRWGHLDTFSPNKTFAFMVSLKSARGFKERLAKGEKITLHASVKAGQHPGNYEVVTATIPGADPKLKDEEIVFSCHLDHQRPGANDNASGCSAILEVARTLQRLINEKKLERPARTIRFVFPPEIEGTLALLNGVGRFPMNSPNPDPRGLAGVYPGPEMAKRFKAVIHLDMVGGGPETKAVFHVTRGPMSLPSFVHDVAWAFADWVNVESYKFASTGKADYPMLAPEGGKEPLRAEYSAFTMGSDHDVYQDSSFGIPAIYLNDWPDRYIHTNFDSAANIDPTKLKRAAFIGAASGYFLAGLRKGGLSGYLDWLEPGRVARLLLDTQRSHELPAEQRANLFAYGFNYDSALKAPVGFAGDLFVMAPAAGHPGSGATGDGLLRFRRAQNPEGPLAVFGYDYFSEHAKAAGIPTPKLLSYEGFWGSGEEYAYEVLNLADGKRNAQEIRDAVSAEYGPVPVEIVVEYLKALEKVGVVAVTH